MKHYYLPCDVPRCPNCSALLYKQMQEGQSFYVCHDCRKIFKVLGNGHSDNEVEIAEGEK